MNNNKKQSLFLKSIKENRSLIDNSKGFPSVINIQNLSNQISNEEEKKNENQPININKKDFFGLNQSEYDKISLESQEMIQKMSPIQIEEAQKELLKFLDPKLVNFFQNKKNANEIKEPKLEIKYNEKKNNENEKFSWFSKVLFDNDGIEKKILKNEIKEEKIEIFCEEQFHSLSNLINILSIFSNNSSVSGFSLFKLEKILHNFYSNFKINNEYLVLNFWEEKLLRIEFLEYVINECQIIEIISKFLNQNNNTLNSNAIKLLNTVLKILVGKNLSIFIKATNQTINDLGNIFYVLKLNF